MRTARNADGRARRFSGHVSDRPCDVARTALAPAEPTFGRRRDELVKRSGRASPGGTDVFIDVVTRLARHAE